MSLITDNKVKTHTCKGMVRKKVQSQQKNFEKFKLNGLVKPYWKVYIRHDSGMITLSIYHGK